MQEGSYTFTIIFQKQMKVSQFAIRLGIDAYPLILILIFLGVVWACFCTIGFPALLLRLGLNQHTLQVLDGTHHQSLPLRLLRRVQLEEAELSAAGAHNRKIALRYDALSHLRAHSVRSRNSRAGSPPHVRVYAHYHR